MLNLIALIILLVSFLGMILIISKKIPVLVELSISRINGPGVLKKTADRIKSNRFVKSLSPDKVLHKTLSKVRVITLKTESKTAEWLKDLRQKSIEKRKSFSDDYWKKLKKK